MKITPVSNNYSMKNNTKSNVNFGMTGKQALDILDAVAKKAVKTGRTPLELIQEETVFEVRKLTEEYAYWIYDNLLRNARIFGDRHVIIKPAEHWACAQRYLGDVVRYNLMPDVKYPVARPDIEVCFESMIGQYK